MSQVTQFFTTSADKKCHICNTCKRSLAISTTGTTSQLWTHLEQTHKNLHTEAVKLREEKNESLKKRKCKQVVIAGETKKLKQTSISAFQSSAKRKIDCKTKKIYDLEILRFIVADGQPFELAAGNNYFFCFCHKC